MVAVFFFDKVERQNSGGLWKVAGLKERGRQTHVDPKPLREQ